MYARLKIPADQFTLIPVDISNKPPEFLSLNPAGTVPVFEDTEKNVVIADSAKITAYIHELFPEPDLQQNYNGPAVEACSGIFPKLAAFLKNKDPSATPALREALEEELTKLDTYLQSGGCQGKYLLCDTVSELDCSILPKLRHVQVAAKYFQKFEIPEKLTALQKYIKDGQSCEVFQQTACKDEEIIKGWSRHGLVKVD
nr:hypothetical protein BaRGS_011886 [Batillaria attramentaria]